MAREVPPHESASCAKPRLVELFGLPGAGKTTITNGLSAGGMLSREDVSVAWRKQSLLRRAGIVVQVLMDFGWMRSIAALAVQTPLTKIESLTRLARLAVTKPWLRSQGRDLLFDQALLQRLWSIFYTEGATQPPHEALTGLLKQFYDGWDVQIVMIEVPPDLAAERVYGRSVGHSRLDELPENAVRTELNNVTGLPAALLRAARDAGLSVVTLDGSARPEVLVAKLQPLLGANPAQESASQDIAGINPSGSIAAK